MMQITSYVKYNNICGVIPFKQQFVQDYFHILALCSLPLCGAYVWPSKQYHVQHFGCRTEL